jgi:hypothetical protein
MTHEERLESCYRQALDEGAERGTAMAIRSGTCAACGHDALFGVRLCRDCGAAGGTVHCGCGMTRWLRSSSGEWTRKRGQREAMRCPLRGHAR